MNQGAILLVFLVFCGGMAAQWIAWRFRLPAIVLLFGLGLLLGPGLDVLHPSELIGPLFHPIVSLAVALIVFEGGMALDFRQWREAGEGILRLTLLALPINWVLGSAAAHYVGGLTWGPACLFGSIVVVTGPTVVLPLLRQAKLQPRIASFLRWEAILNDPVGAILAALVLEILLMRPDEGTGAFVIGILPQVIISLIVSIGLGISGGWAVRQLFVRDLMPEQLKMPLLLTLALALYALGSLFMDGAGLMAATVFGMALANMRVPGLGELQRMKESLVVLIVSLLFILLTADLQRVVLERLSWSIFALTCAVIFVVRPLGIYLSTIGSALSWSDRIFLGWIAPRGIVAAAVAGVSGIRLSEAGFVSAEFVMPAVFAVIAATMLLHGFSLTPLARRLHLTLSNVPALAIVGASAWSRNLAEVMIRSGTPVTLVDTAARGLVPARRAGVPVLHAEMLSEAGAESLEELPADYLIAATPDAIYNGMVCAHLAPHFGRARVYQVSPGIRRLDQYRGLSRDARGKVLGQPEWNFTLLDTLFADGWRFQALNVTAGTFETYARPDGSRLVLVTIRPGVGFSIQSAEDAQQEPPVVGDVLIAFVPSASATDMSEVPASS
ncbi:cation:proton antiporter [Acetobacter oeni]|uniref:Sodium/hydrogen exchanger n=1 Tax=Acetobacter oeni TaxID=304077 RepID=A0A511XI40_9PROT|nr:sodium:proton antiporter [Acetobacter oeni]MBB3883024.1 NhaP-type Na+/H+ or K+/H+ antiporter [Acetobacter oeni]NHO19100.1 sodium:proton antiporter [Acetobacter oeni]GBR11627.1 Na+/H+ antiporter [Acetobacter oeni LMG 21952]GEN62609.1 sodium/hydrogen exchanger [Acetobacter oeni]